MKFVVWGCHESEHLSFGYAVCDTLEEASSTVEMLNSDSQSTGTGYWYEEVEDDFT